MIGRRVNIDGPGDNPDEYWFECDFCEGTGEVSIPYVDEYENIEEGVSRPGCDGLGCVERDAADV